MAIYQALVNSIDNFDWDTPSGSQNTTLDGRDSMPRETEQQTLVTAQPGKL
ncbi:MAG: hypothetical protein P8J68_03180 [Arenicellaceae bacterium]|nr:hypothetical protein [Arenicellaceae bacterium]